MQPRAHLFHRLFTDHLSLRLVIVQETYDVVHQAGRYRGGASDLSKMFLNFTTNGKEVGLDRDLPARHDSVQQG